MALRRTTKWVALAAVALLLPLNALASGNLRIVGALSNFDCYNDTGSDCEGFEIEIEDSSPSDVSYTWHYSAFGAPTISATTGADGLPATLVRYDSPTATVPSGGVTHFGVTLTAFVQPGQILRRWLPKATVTVPNPVPVPVNLPTHTSEVVSTNGVSAVRDGITNSNPDGGETYWIEPFVNIVRKRSVALDELMTDNQVVTGSQSLGLERLDPQNTWTNDDAGENDDTDSAILSYKVYQDVVTIDSNGVDHHAPGVLLAVVMDASVTSTSADAISSLTLSSSSVYGTQSVTGTVRLSGPAGVKGNVVNLSTTAPNSTFLPKTLTIPANASSATFTITTKAVSALTIANITAASSSGFTTASLTINPPDFTLLWLAYLSVKGGTTFNGAVYIDSPAPSGGIVVHLSSNSTAAKVPATVTIPAGGTTARFTVTSRKVTAVTNVTITGTVGTTQQTATVRLY